MVSCGAISTILSDIQSKFRGLDRRIHSAHEEFEAYYEHNGTNVQPSSLYREEGPAESALETLEALEQLEKEMDSAISAITESNSTLEGFNGEMQRHVTDWGRFCEVRETLNDILHINELDNEEGQEKSEEEKENEDPKTEDKEPLRDEPNLLHFGISKYGLEKFGYSFYSKETQSEKKKESLDPLQRPPIIIPPIVSKPSLPQFGSPLLQTKDRSSFELNTLSVSIPSLQPLRELPSQKPEEISPGLFVRVKPNKGRKTVTPEAPSMSYTLQNQPLILSSSLLKTCESNVMDSHKKNVDNGLNDSFGPPPKPKLFTRDL
ncbi:unnamed protein product [Lepeophtheirus salmonis]|uniref:(salmon louse) hypothetical protein n=1 Tax=Lepeophtheirus salmonis TaxID=72036 RepID=A0A7R8HBC8_LEPSM|nr:unnamed protein product [Lepeophtheirus salmonis]CAF2979539.1 unnamed protein product [Lepeophtheirus salmonis]